MHTSNHNVDPALTTDPLIDCYHCCSIDEAQSPEEIKARRERSKQHFVVDLHK
ncbi:MAG TPA: hypothetical protein VI386_17700 [Candidatus Sulfotelmatobacter sp.]